MMDQNFEFTYKDEPGLRLDKFLVANLNDFSRSRLQDLIRNGFVLVNNEPQQKSGFIVNQGDMISLHIPPVQTTEIIPEEIPLKIVYEDKNLLIVDKPAGMVVHPSAGHFSGTLVHAALAHSEDFEGIGGELRPGVVHRLDKDTSGLILLAKNDRTLNWLQDQFRLRNVKKVYIALVDGFPPTPTGRIEAAIGRDPYHRKKMAIVPLGKGREAISEYITLRKFSRHTLLEVHPQTGRTHQIRLHLAFLGCPVVGDTIYGSQNCSLPLDRFFLHATRLTIRLPGENVERTFEAKLPEELQNLIDKLS
jgi:23S rRNA pseudouridine1911/1915/1917 synthase